MDKFLLLAYISGGLLVIYSLFTFIFPSRKLNLLLKAGADLLSAINLVFVYIYTRNPLIIAGMVTLMIGLVREILFSFKNSCKALNHIAWPIVFSSLFALSLIFTYRSPLSILPPVASVISTIFFFVTNQKIFKIGAIVVNSLYATYYLILIPSSDVLTIFSLLTSLMGLISSIVGLFVIFYKQRQAKRSENESKSEETHEHVENKL